MKDKFLIILFLTQISYSQTENDNYKLYSKIISNHIETENKAIVIKNYKSEIEYLDMVFDTRTDEVTNLELQYIYDKEFVKRLIKEPKLKKVATNLKYLETHKSEKINPNLLKVKSVELQFITSRKYKSYFKSIFKKNRISKGWKRIKRKYKSDIIFDFSKISYLGNYASFYYGLHCGGLCGSGNIVIFEKINGKWNLITELNIWMA